jgi:polar amino acid transport system substrate-binding protein
MPIACSTSHPRSARRCLLAVLCAAWQAGQAIAAPEAPELQDTLVLAMPTTSFRSPQGPWLMLIYQEAFSRIGRQIDIVPMPTSRASAMASSGQVDGDLHRGYSYGLQHPTLVRVDQSHFSATFAAYSKLPQLRLAPGWSGLDGTKLRVQYVLGSVTSTAELQRRVAPSLLSTVTDVQQGLQKLQLERSDILVALDANVDPLLALDEQRRSGVRKVSQLGQVDGYLYLNSKHAALAPRLAQVLLQMKREGRIAQLEKQARALAAAPPPTPTPQPEKL